MSNDGAMNRNTASLPFSLKKEKWNAPYFLAPVAGYSDAAFRAVCAEMGAALCYTEMVSSEALVRGHKKTRELLERDPAEAAYAIQLFGANPAVLAKAAALVAEYRPVVIDLNCGCPVPKIIKSGAGSALLKTPERIEEIVRAMRDASPIPVSVKLRIGWDKDSINYMETAEAAIRGGACAVTLHGRTRAQGYAGQADWNAIRNLTEQSPIPVFGSGDVFSACAAIDMRQRTGCAGVMVARGAIGNPFIFSELRDIASRRDAPSPYEENADTARALDPHLIAETALHHLSLAVQHFGEKSACMEFRKHFCAYTKGLPGGAPLRARAVHCSSFEEFSQILNEMRE